MSVDQEKRADLAEARLALAEAKTRRLGEAFFSAACTAMGVLATISYYFLADGRAFLALLAGMSGASIMISFDTLRTLNKAVRKRRRKVEEFSGE
ncbi:hypothetical protein F4X86_02030 [Candidatus Saccharibacteria bacterium]|nr:hypothetical protein [Candidatus Saccharibacteria bacterium]